MELVIRCQHERGETATTDPLPVVDDYHALTKHELRELLKLASVATGRQVSTIQVRLTQGIRGMTCPRPYGSEAGKRMSALDSLYISTYSKDPRELPDLVEEFWEIMEG